MLSIHFAQCAWCTRYAVRTTARRNTHSHALYVLAPARVRLYIQYYSRTSIIVSAAAYSSRYLTLLPAVNGEAPTSPPTSLTIHGPIDTATTGTRHLRYCCGTFFTTRYLSVETIQRVLNDNNELLRVLPCRIRGDRSKRGCHMLQGEF